MKQAHWSKDVRKENDTANHNAQSKCSKWCRFSISNEHFQWASFPFFNEHYFQWAFPFSNEQHFQWFYAAFSMSIISNDFMQQHFQWYSKWYCSMILFNDIVQCKTTQTRLARFVKGLKVKHTSRKSKCHTTLSSVSTWKQLERNTYFFQCFQGFWHYKTLLSHSEICTQI